MADKNTRSRVETGATKLSLTDLGQDMLALIASWIVDNNMTNLKDYISFARVCRAARQATHLRMVWARSHTVDIFSSYDSCHLSFFSPGDDQPPWLNSKSFQACPIRLSLKWVPTMGEFMVCGHTILLSELVNTIYKHARIPSTTLSAAVKANLRALQPGQAVPQLVDGQGHPLAPLKPLLSLMFVRFMTPHDAHIETYAPAHEFAQCNLVQLAVDGLDERNNAALVKALTAMRCRSLEYVSVNGPSTGLVAFTRTLASLRLETMTIKRCTMRSIADPLSPELREADVQSAGHQRVLRVQDLSISFHSDPDAEKPKEPLSLVTLLSYVCPNPLKSIDIAVACRPWEEQRGLLDVAVDPLFFSTTEALLKLTNVHLVPSDGTCSMSSSRSLSATSASSLTRLSLFSHFKLMTAIRFMQCTPSLADMQAIAGLIHLRQLSIGSGGTRTVDPDSLATLAGARIEILVLDISKEPSVAKFTTHTDLHGLAGLTRLTCLDIRARLNVLHGWRMPDTVPLKELHLHVMLPAPMDESLRSPIHLPANSQLRSLSIELSNRWGIGVPEDLIIPSLSSLARPLQNLAVTFCEPPEEYTPTTRHNARVPSEDAEVQRDWMCAKIETLHLTRPEMYGSLSTIAQIDSDQRYFFSQIAGLVHNPYLQHLHLYIPPIGDTTRWDALVSNFDPCVTDFTQWLALPQTFPALRSVRIVCDRRIPNKVVSDLRSFLNLTLFIHNAHNAITVTGTVIVGYFSGAGVIV